MVERVRKESMEALVWKREDKSEVGYLRGGHIVNVSEVRAIAWRVPVVCAVFYIL